MDILSKSQVYSKERPPRYAKKLSIILFGVFCASRDYLSLIGYFLAWPGLTKNILDYLAYVHKMYIW